MSHASPFEQSITHIGHGGRDKTHTSIHIGLLARTEDVAPLFLLGTGRRDTTCSDAPFAFMPLSICVVVHSLFGHLQCPAKFLIVVIIGERWGTRRDVGRGLSHVFVGRKGYMSHWRSTGIRRWS